MNKARQAFYTKLIEDNSCNQRKLFRASKSLFNQSQGDELPPNLHAPTFAREVGKYFVSKIDTIQRKIDADIIDLPASAFTTADGFNRSTPSLPAFKILSANSGKSLIHNSTLKSCPLDPMPLSLGQQMWCSSPRHYYDHWQIIRSRTLSQVLKEALVCPLLKKPGLHIILKNFRQVSNLAFLSKLTEKALFRQIHEHMVDTNLYPNVQSAYRVHHSTETAFLKSCILLNMNKQHVTLLVLLDLSAAFDTVEHKILLEALNTLGLGGRVSKWFRSYLSGRNQRILVRGCLSKFDLNCEVPQGSCLGPLLLWEFMWRYCYFSPKAAARVKSPSLAKKL